MQLPTRARKFLPSYPRINRTNFSSHTYIKEGDESLSTFNIDHNRDLIGHRANVTFDDPEAARYAWGIGFHWYETGGGGETMDDNLAVINESYPDKKLLFTEGTVEGFRADRYQYWPNAERWSQSCG